MISINFKVIGFTRPGFKPAGSRAESTIFGFLDLPEQEADALLIQTGVRLERFYCSSIYGRRGECLEVCMDIPIGAYATAYRLLVTQALVPGCGPIHASLVLK